MNAALLEGKSSQAARDRKIYLNSPKVLEGIKR
jgi:hypothetical protein